MIPSTQFLGLRFIVYSSTELYSLDWLNNHKRRKVGVLWVLEHPLFLLSLHRNVIFSHNKFDDLIYVSSTPSPEELLMPLITKANTVVQS